MFPNFLIAHDPLGFEKNISYMMSETGCQKKTPQDATGGESPIRGGITVVSLLFWFGVGKGTPPNPERSLGQGQGCFSSSLRVDAVSNQAEKSMGSKEGMW